MMVYRRVWKKESDGTIHEMDLNPRRYVTCMARVGPDVMPRWLTDDPMPEDFDIWAESIPRRESYEFLEEYDFDDCAFTIQVLEREGTIERGSYTQRRYWNSKERTHSQTVCENADYHCAKRENSKSSWRFPESHVCSDLSWYASKLSACSHGKKR